MPVVSNTSPILNLAIIERLFLLHQQFGTIQIATAVFAELRVNEDLPGSDVIREAIAREWIVVTQVEDIPLVQLLSNRLGRCVRLSSTSLTVINAIMKLIQWPKSSKINQKFNIIN